LEGVTPEALRNSLPRLRREAVWQAVGLEPLAPVGSDEVRSAGPGVLVACAEAASGYQPGEDGWRRGRSLDVWRAAAAMSSHRSAEVAMCFGVPPRTLRDWASRAPTQSASYAIRLQMALQRSLGTPPDKT